MTTVSQIATSPTQTTSSNASLSSTVDMNEQFNTFIKLLTAQMRNQDPLNPSDSTQFVEQLATFSTLEQQVRSNDTLETISSLINDLNSMVASDWLGQSVTVASAWVPYSGETVEYGFDAPVDYDQAALTVKDSNGNIVWMEQLENGSDTYIWNGQLNDGSTAPVDSLYQFGIELFEDGIFVGSVPPLVKTTVTDVAAENGKIMIGTEMKLTANVDQVRKLDVP